MTTPLTKYYYGNLGIGGGLLSNITTVTTSYTIDSGSTPDYVILCNFSAAHTITLPVPTAGRTLIIKDGYGTAATYNITIARHGSETIEGKAASYILSGNYDKITLLSDGTNWFIQSKVLSKYDNGPVYNVLDYGLVADGSTANDTAFASLMTLINTLAIGATVLFPSSPHNYVFNSPVTFTPENCIFKGSDFGQNTILQYNGPGIFWYASAQQRYENLTFSAYYRNAVFDGYVQGQFGFENPSRQCPISNASNTSPIQITTPFPHTYNNGDLIGIYGVQGNVYANCDPAAPWTISVIDGYNFTLHFSTTVAAASNSQVLSGTYVLNVSYTNGMPSSGILTVVSTAGIQTVTYTGKTTTSFTGCTGGTGTIHTGNAVLVNSAGSGAFTSQTLSISAVTGNGVSPIVVTTSSTASLFSDQQVYISGVTGNTAANGPFRAWPQNSTQLALYPQGNPSYSTTGNGNYTGGGTIYNNGTCLNYSQVALVGLNLGTLSQLGMGPVVVENCSFGGFKYSISLDSCENITISNCLLGYANANGYVYDMAANDSTHSSAGIRIGCFLTWPQVNWTNVIFIDGCNFFNHYTGVHHHDSYSHFITNCNYENQTIAQLTQGPINISYENCTNDESGDTKGLIQFASDQSYTSSFVNIFSIRGCYVTGASSLIYNNMGDAVIGISIRDNLIGVPQYLINNVFGGSAQPPISPIIIDGNSAPSTIAPTNSGFASPNLIDNQNLIYTQIPGTSINHYQKLAASLDVGVALNTTETPTFVTRLPNTLSYPNAYYSYQSYTGAGGTFTGGSLQKYDNVLSSVSVDFSGGSAGARVGMGLGWNYISIGGSNITLAPTNIPSSFCAGVIKMTVQAALVEYENVNAFWKITQKFYKTSLGISFGTLEEYEYNDPIGLTVPTMAFIGTYPSYKNPGTQQVQATVYSYAHSTTIASGSDGYAWSQSTIYVASTTGFPSSGTLHTILDNGNQVMFNYTGTTTGANPSFTGVTPPYGGGGGNLKLGNAVGIALEYSAKFDIEQVGFY